MNQASPARAAVPRETNDYAFHCSDPSRVLDRILALNRLRNDAELSRVLSITPPTISKIRAGKIAMTASFVLRVHEVLHIPVAELRALMAANRQAGA